MTPQLQAICRGADVTLKQPASQHDGAARRGLWLQEFSFRLYPLFPVFFHYLCRFSFFLSTFCVFPIICAFFGFSPSFPFHSTVCAVCPFLSTIYAVFFRFFPLSWAHNLKLHGVCLFMIRALVTFFQSVPKRTVITMWVSEIKLVTQLVTS